MGQRIHKEGLCSIDFAHKINIFSCTWNCQEGLTNINSSYYKASRNSHSWNGKLVFKWWKRTSECFMGLTSKWLKNNWLNFCQCQHKTFKKKSVLWIIYCSFKAQCQHINPLSFYSSLTTPARIILTCRMVTYICSVVSNVTRLGNYPNYSMLWRSRKSIFSTSTVP